MQRKISDLKYNLRYLQLGAYALSALLLLSPEISRADESGVSFWIPKSWLIHTLSITACEPKLRCIGIHIFMPG